MIQGALKYRRVLVIAAHPDDEVLGCGGTIARHVSTGGEVRVVIVCEGESLRYGANGVNQRGSIKKAADLLGVSEWYTLDFRDQMLDKVSLVEVITPLEDIVHTYQPHIVYCQHGGDLNKDHQIVSQAALVALRPIERVVQDVYAFYTPSSTEWAFPNTFTPDTWVDIGDHMGAKVKAFRCYQSEVRPSPHPRSVEAIVSRAKAVGSKVCLEHAEEFMTIRKVFR